MYSLVDPTTPSRSIDVTPLVAGHPRLFAANLTMRLGAAASVERDAVRCLDRMVPSDEREHATRQRATTTTTTTATSTSTANAARTAAATTIGRLASAPAHAACHAANAALDGSPQTV